MYSVDPSFLVFAIILAISLIIPEMLKEAKMIVVPFYIIAGVVLHLFWEGFADPGTDFKPHEALVFIGEIGVLFLVFIAGLEIHEHDTMKWKTPVYLSVVSAGVCFFFGYMLGQYLNESQGASFLLGTILMSSSVSEIIPIVTASVHLRQKFADFLFPAVIIMDAASLFLLTVLLRWDLAPLDFAFFLAGTIALTLLIVFILPRFSRWFFARKTIKPRETDLKFIITVLIISVFIGEVLSIHGIFIAFVVGAMLGHRIPNEKTYHKLHGFGHGFFIPIFFVVLGMKLDIFILGTPSGVFLLFAIVAALVVSKIVGALLFGYFNKLKPKEGVLLGTTLWPQLSATLAAASVGFKEEIFDDELLTAIVLMSIIMGLITPLFVRYLTHPEEKHHDLRNHILIVGYGRTSARLAYLLDMDEKDFIVIDRKLSRVNFLKRQGIDAILGDGDDYNVLKKANVEYARIAVITIPDDHEVYLCAKHIKETNPDCHIVARVHDWDTFEKLKNENLIDYAVWPEKLSSEVIIKHIIDSDLWEHDEDEKRDRVRPVM